MLDPEWTEAKGYAHALNLITIEDIPEVVFEEREHTEDALPEPDNDNRSRFRWLDLTQGHYTCSCGRLAWLKYNGNYYCLEGCAVKAALK